MEFTDLGAIKYCIKKKLEGAEGLLTTYNRRKRLDNMDSVHSLQKLLATIHKDVELAVNPKNGKFLSGSKPRHIVGELRSEKVKKEDKREGNGNKPTENDDIIMEYFFNMLSKRLAKRKEEGWSETYNIWGKDWINQLEFSDSEWAAYETNLKNVFKDYPEITEKRISEIISNIKENLRKNHRALAVKSIERLEKKERIETEIEFFQAFAKGSMVVTWMTEMEDENTKHEEKLKMHQKIDEDRHLEVVEGITKLITPSGMSFGRYKIVSAFKHYGTEEELAMIKVVGKWLFDEYSIDYLYNRVRIFVTNDEIEVDVSHEEMYEAFVGRIIEKTNKRMNRKDYKATHKFQNVFYRLSMFLLLDMKKIDGLKEQIELEKKMISEAISNCIFNYAVKYGDDLMKDEEEVRWAFGEKTEKQAKKIEIPVNFDELFLPTPVEIVEPKVVSEEMEWMNRMSKYTKKKEQIKPVVTNNKPKIEMKTKGMIDMNLIGLEDNMTEIEVEEDNRPFGWQLDEPKEEEKTLDASLLPLESNYTIKPQRPTYETHGSEYFMAMVQYLDAM